MNEQESQGLQVLVVHDNTEGGASLAELLRLRGHQVAMVQNGPAALQVAGSNQPDVVLLDIELLELAGCEVARRIREGATGKKPFIIAVTGCPPEDDASRWREAGIDLHLVKPVIPDQLESLLRRFQAFIAW